MEVYENIKCKMFNIYILYKIYILHNMFHSKTAREAKPKI